jgi:hypothetical protein
MKVGTLVELSAYGRGLKWMRHSFNGYSYSDYAIVLEHMRLAIICTLPFIGWTMEEYLGARCHVGHSARQG